MPRPLLWVSLGFIAGIVLAKLLAVPLYVWLILALLALVMAILLHRLGTHLGLIRLPASLPPLQVSTVDLISACVVALLLGAARLQSTLPGSTTSQISGFNDRQYDLLIAGTLVQPPDYRDTYTDLRLQASQVDTGLDQFKVSGLVLARVGPNQTYRYGDNLRLRGRLLTPPENEDFSYRDYLAREGILSYMSSAEATLLPGTTANPILAAIYCLRDASLGNVYRLFLDPEASLLAGILLGVDSGLPARLEQAFIDTGTAHIIAISGFNIAILAGVFTWLFGRLFGPRLGALLALPGIFFYTVLVGGGPSVFRAAFMGALSIFALQAGRRQDGLTALAFTAAFLAFFTPLSLWDVGFQLSFFATLGLILYGGPFQSAAERFISRHFPASDAQKLATLLGEFVLLTLAAQLTTLPIVAYQFQQISLISFIANPFILPAQPLVMILGGLAVFISLFVYPLGQLAAWIAWPLTAYTVRVVELFDSVPHGVIYLGGFSLAFVILFYAALFAVTFAGPQLKTMLNSLRERFPFLSLTAFALALLICTLFLWRLVAAAPDGRMHITFLDVGSADGVLIETPGGRDILINGGPSTSTVSDGLGRRLSPLDHRLDWLVLASTDENQVASLPRLLPRYPPENVLFAGNAQSSFSSGEVMQWLDDHTVPVQRAETGQALDLGNGGRLKVLHASTSGATLLVEWNSFRAVLPIGEDLNTLTQLQYGAVVGPVDVLLLAQSGYAQLTPPDWLKNLNPRLVVISVSAADPDGLPDKDTLDALSGYSVLRTDLNGWIEVMTDGKQMWVRDERK
jgi:competence protein ComEC